MKRITSYLLGLLAVCIAGCAAVGQQPARSPEDSFRYAQVSVAAAYRYLGDGQRDRTMSVAEYNRLKPQVDQAKGYFDEADKFVTAGVPVTATTVQDKIRLALAILQPILIELQKRYPPKAAFLTLQPTGA